MLSKFHSILMAFYIAAPILIGVYAMVRARDGVYRPAGNLLVTIIIGALLGSAATTVYAVGVGGRIVPAQFALAVYFAIALLLTLNLFDLLVQYLLQKLGGGKFPAPAAAFVRGMLLIGVGLPYILSALMTYRPRVIHQGDPVSILGSGFEQVQFESTDGVKLSGWWIPVQSGPQRDEIRLSDFGTRTVVVCHGLGADKTTQLALARKLLPAGYNVLIFDFRAHGQSDGRFTSMGDLERRDVLGAVQWVRREHAKEAQRIVGVGVNMGATALIAAAVDDSDAGRAIEAIAVYGAYDDLDRVTMELMQNRFLPPMDWIIPRLGLPMASLQAGADLGGFKPANLVRALWPRPILVIHGVRDRLVPFDRGGGLFDAASFPKKRLWLLNQDQDEALDDNSAADAVREFFDDASSMPVI